jgi:hypothetical protein
MAQMVRKQIYIEKRQEALLKRIAKARGVSEAEFIRQAIDRQIRSGASHPTLPDPQAWERAYQFMLSRDRLGIDKTQAYKWKREDAYEERLSRYDLKTTRT